MAREDKGIKFRIINAICSFLLLGAIIYALIASFDLIAIGIISASLTGAATPVILTGEGFLEIVVGIFEALLEGVFEIIAGIANAIGSIFG